MNPVVIGTPDEVLGFALAGATTFAATTNAEVEKAIDRAVKTIDHPIVILSHHAAELVHERIDAWEHGTSGPLYAILPAA